MRMSDLIDVPEDRTRGIGKIIQTRRRQLRGNELIRRAGGGPMTVSMGPADATNAPKKPITPFGRRPVAPASARAYVPFVPPGRTSHLDPIKDGPEWTRLCGRVGMTAAGMGVVCMAVSLLTGGHGPAPYLTMPFQILGAVIGCTGVFLSGKQRLAGWRVSGAAVLVAIIGLTFDQAATMLRAANRSAPAAPAVVIIADQNQISPQTPASTDPDSSPAPTPVVTAPAPAEPVVVTDQLIMTRADTLLANQLGFAFGPGWVAVGRSGTAAIALTGLDPASPQLLAMRRAMPMNVSVVVIAIDNTDGTKAVEIDPEFVKATTASGATVSALSPRLVLSTAAHDADTYLKRFGHAINVPAGAKLDQAVIFFPANVDVTKLHGITFTVNGTLMTFRGHVMSKAEKAALTPTR
jgi:hypothetical protein